MLSVQVRVGRGFPERPVPQTRVADSPSTTATVPDPGPENLAPTAHDNNMEREAEKGERRERGTYVMLSFSKNRGGGGHTTSHRLCPVVHNV